MKAETVFLLLLSLCVAAEGTASAKGKAYVAVFYRTFEDEEDLEAADVRAALNEALEDAGIAYREYDGEGNPLIQLLQIVQEKDAMVLLVNPAEQGFDDAGEDIGAGTLADIVAQTDGRPLIFFDCEISEETTDMTEELCVLVNAAEFQSEAETETELTRAEIIAAEFQAEAEAETEVTRAEIVAAEFQSEVETEATRAEIIAAESQLEAETKQGAEIETENERETETETEVGMPEKNIRGMAEAIASIAGNYMTGAGYFEGLEEDWVTDGWRVDVPCRF